MRSLAQALAREHSAYGVHAVHAVVNGGVCDPELRLDDGDDGAPSEDRAAMALAVRTGKKMSAAAVGETYLWLSRQRPELWTHELDLRPAAERF